MYLITTPWWLRFLYPLLTWQIKTDEKIIYLTFDDGPHEVATPFVLNILKKYNAKATFFCIGKNVQLHPDIYTTIIEEGHSVGNHTFNHLNGWKVSDEIYFNDIKKAADVIQSSLFRPPYGRIKKSQTKILKTNYNIIMWSVLSGDFDIKISPEKCLNNVISNIKNGSVVVFHDSAKAMERLEFALPKTLEYFSNKGYVFKSIQM
ncbi:MAG: polysaccharide deacetylase family protein [Bacteroidetes bacterium]|nr:polysaccharide deacetylase family protein [Bacteroidota bacterium]MBS1649802.1 polysaccharide deacetylase family protein [Bacteroidota bacterium]